MSGTKRFMHAKQWWHSLIKKYQITTYDRTLEINCHLQDPFLSAFSLMPCI